MLSFCSYWWSQLRHVWVNACWNGAVFQLSSSGNWSLSLPQVATFYACVKAGRLTRVKTNQPTNKQDTKTKAKQQEHHKQTNKTQTNKTPWWFLPFLCCTWLIRCMSYWSSNQIYGRELPTSPPPVYKLCVRAKRRQMQPG